MDKFLFLDMDGVVNSVEYSVGTQPNNDGHMHDEADPVKLGLIRFICEQTDAKIVISSTWRIGRSVDWFKGYFERFGWSVAPVVGVTPELRSHDPAFVGRGDEVVAWLDRNTANKEYSYVILDDDGDFYNWQTLIKCNAVYGITLKEALVAINKLGLGKLGDEKLINDLQKHVDFKDER